LEDPEQFNSSSMLERLDAEVKNMTVLSRKVASVDEQVSTSRAYISKMMLKERQGRFADTEEFEIGASSAERSYNL